MSPEDAVKVIIILLVYILPFAILPFIVGSVTNVGGALTGRVNNRARGLFDRSRKSRQEMRSNAAKAFLSGQRGRATSRFFKNREGNNRRGLFASTGLALGTLKNQEVGTRKKLFYPTAGGQARRQAAFADYDTQLKNNEAQSARARSLKDNDLVNRALVAAVGTDGSTEAIRQAMLEQFPKMSREDIETAIEGAVATGGFSEARARVAFSALTASGTGWDSIDQVVEGAQRLSRGNKSVAASILGEHNAVTKGVGRHDLAPGFANVIGAWEQAEEDARNGVTSRSSLRRQAVQDARQRVLASGGTEDEAFAAAQAAAQNFGFLDKNKSAELYAAAGKDVDPYSMLRQKKAAIENMSAGLSTTLAASVNTMNDTTRTGEQREAAAAEAGRLSGAIDKMQAHFSSGSVTSVEAAGSNAVIPTVQIRQDLEKTAAAVAPSIPPVIIVRDEVTGTLTTVKNPEYVEGPELRKMAESRKLHTPPSYAGMSPAEIAMREEMEKAGK